MTSFPDEAKASNDILEVRDLLIHRQGQSVLEVEQFQVREGETLAIIGPNGAGKTTLLLALAWLIRPVRGQVFFRSRPVTSANQLEVRRRMGLVLQEPFLLQASVFNNVACGLRFRGLPHHDVERRASEWLNRLEIAHLRDRPAHQLSGGEAQRASLARALAIQPDVLMLDEPFSSLDAPTRTKLMQDLKSLLKGQGLTTLLVTHDLDEALFLGERVGVIIAGRIRQIERPDRVFSAPVDRDVASFVGVETVIPGMVVASHGGTATVQTTAGILECMSDEGQGAPVYLCLRPEDIIIHPEKGQAPSGAINHISGVINQMLPQGPLVRIVVNAGIDLVALIPRQSAQEMELIEGQTVQVQFNASVIHVIKR
jgi:tungstate transport system ATP-binding protein